MGRPLYSRKDLNFINKYYLEYFMDEKIQMAILREFAREWCGKDANSVSNKLIRGGIRSIRDLHEASTTDIAKIKNIGPVALSHIIDMKNDICNTVNSADNVC